MKNLIGKNWHNLPVDEVIDLLDSDKEKGLDLSEAVNRRKQFGPNVITGKKRKGPLLRFLLQFHNPLIYVLLFTAVITALLREFVDSGVIMGVVIINAVVGFIQESKAEKAIESLKKMLSPSAATLRDGRKIVVPAEDLVPGDVVFIQSGDKTPADLRLFKAKNLQIDEAPLTGESLPVSKATEAIDKELPVADRINMAFSGTLVTYGQGAGVVAATGDNTEIGRIAGMLQDVKETETPLIRKLDKFSKVLMVVIMSAAGLLFLFGVLRGNPAIEMFMAAVALAVSAIPEGLPAVMTITLAIGVKRMAARHAIIRRLPAVETLGSATVICSDKTGTLTRNEMTVVALETPCGSYSVTGVGYEPSGSFMKDGREIEPSDEPALFELLMAGFLCNDALVKNDNDSWIIEGDPTEGALIVAAMKSGSNTEDEKKKMPRTDEIPFESDNQFMATLHHDHHMNGYIYVKGAPEKVIAFCSGELHGNSDNNEHKHIDKQFWEKKTLDLAAGGLRVLALAVKYVPARHEILELRDVEEGFFFLGLVGMIDPPRDEAIKAVELCKKAGIRVKMITGDHLLTAKTIAEQIGIRGERIVSGQDLEGMEVTELQRLVRDADVYARVSPGHKLKLVQALQANGEIVAMTGDGVNDAPALKQADIGIAMGITGTEVAKEASAVVLTDDNFASIERAVEEGRTVFSNLQKTILFILPTNGGECLLIISAILLGMVLPVLPLQILWINLITTVALAITLAFEPVEAGVMDRPPRRPDAPLIDMSLVRRIALVSLIMAVGTFGLFYFETSRGADIAAARAVAVNTVVFFEAVYLFNARYLRDSVLSLKGFLGNKIVLLGIGVVVLFQMIFTYWSVTNRLFHVAPIGMMSWLRIIIVSSSLLLIIELAKAVERRVSEK
ncbi:MAG: carbonate dehydratase [Nitrospirae bacterium RBG_16_43_11]|nr:MAG: carbonate dehydratase [Nitrospirae bacterium RBG_16_43_11]